MKMTTKILLKTKQKRSTPTKNLKYNLDYNSTCTSKSFIYIKIF